MNGNLQDTSTDSPIEVIRYSAGTDIGLKREENQDSFGLVKGKEFRLFIVADGMGGVKGGAIASNLAIEVVRETLESSDKTSPELVCSAIIEANSKIYQRGLQDQKLHGMGTTFVGILFIDHEAYILNVGDSRAYLVRDREITQLTQDHTLVGELVRSGALTEEQAENHPVSHMLTRSLGPTEEVQPDCFKLTPGPISKDLFLLCSDGLYNLVSDEEIQESLLHSSPDAAVQELINLANQRGGTDNITIIIVEVPETFLSRSETEEDPDLELVNKVLSADREGVLGEGSIHSGDLPSIAEVAITEVSPGVKPTAVQKFFNNWYAIPGVILVLITLLVGLQHGFLPRTGKEVKSERAASITPEDLSAVLQEFAEDDIADSRNLVEKGLELETNEGAAPVKQVASKKVNEFDSFIEKRSNLRAEIEAVDRKIQDLDSPLSGKLAEEIKEATRRFDAEKQKLKDLDIDLEAATRSLSLWVGRRKRLARIDAVNLGAELAQDSQLIAKYKEDFERISWAYIKQVETWKYSPSDEQIRSSVAKLAKERTQAKTKLESGIRYEIDKNIDDLNQKIADLTEHKDRVQTRIQNFEKDLRFAKVLTSGSSSAKRKLRDELLFNRHVLSSELKALDLMFQEIDTSSTP